MNSEIDFKAETIFEVVEKNAQRYPNRFAIDFMDKVMSYESFLLKIESSASSFHDLGIKTGDRIALCLPNCPQAIISMYALNRLGAVSVILNPLSPSLELFRQIQTTDCIGVVILDLLLPKLINAYQSCPKLKFIISANIISEMSFTNSVKTSIFGLSRIMKAHIASLKIKPLKWRNLIKGCPILPPKVSSPEDAAIIIFSGGTAGKPKAVVHSSLSINTSIYKALSTEPPIEDKMSMVAILPYFHIFGLTVAIHMAFAAPGTCILVPRFNADNLARIFIKKKPTYTAAVPTIFEGLLKSRVMRSAVKNNKLDMQKFRVAFCGGDKLKEETYHRFNDIIKTSGGEGYIAEGYGLTECCPVTVMPRSEYCKGSLGKPLPDVSICIVEPGTKNIKDTFDEGEICVSGSAMMKGYLNSPDVKQEALVVHDDGKLWLHTGDIGIIDPEGFLFFRDRLRRLIKVSGNSVFANHVEEVLESHPCVYKACVTSIPDDYSIQKIKAYIVLRHHAKIKNIEQDILAHCNKNLMPWSVPEIIEFRKKIPVNLVGKASFETFETK